MPLADGLECDYFYDKSQCQVPDLGALTPGKRSAMNSLGIFPRESCHKPRNLKINSADSAKSQGLRPTV